MTSSSTLASIAKQQKPDGSFVIVGKHGGAPPRSVVATLHAFLLDVLGSNGNAEAKKIAARLASYLLSELHADEITVTDTRAAFHALASLHEYDAALITPDMLAVAIRFLVAHELAVGGPYRSATASNDAPDFDTNVSICRFMYHFGGPFPRLNEYIATAKTDASPYFASAWPRQIMFAAMQRALGGAPTAITTRPTVFLCKDPHKPSAVYGMPAIVDAQKLIHDNNVKQAAVHQEPKRRVTYDRVLACAIAASAGNEKLANLLTLMAQRDRNEEIGLLALRFAPAMAGKRPPRQTLEILGAANLYNWVAYTIYDDFLDNEGEPAKLPLANTALRTAVQLFEEALCGEAFKAHVHAAFDAVDAANVWELAHCRFAVTDKTITISTLPDYDGLRNLYGRSLTHSLPTIGALAGAGFALDGSMVRTTLSAFKQYLIIRQLNDDLRDWEDDLRAGHISYVVARLLQDAKIPHGAQPLDALVAKLKQTFLYQTLRTICEDILARGEQAHQLLAGVHARNNPNALDELIGRYEQATRRMVTQHGYATTFMRAYKTPNATAHGNVKT